MLLEKVDAFLKENQFKLANRRILVGVSGGPDSLALLHFLWSRRKRLALEIAVSHVDHMFRGEESLLEAKFLQEFCGSRNIPFYFRQIDVPQYIKKTGKSAQVAARECRYHYFEELMQELDFHLLALGHHGDDQIETILMRLTRGSTGKARAGIPFSREFSSGMLFRPLLCLSREEIESYCAYYELDPRRDPSNDKDTYSRNRYRHQIVPFLKSQNPLVHEQFQRFSEDILADEIYLHELTVQHMNKVMKTKKHEEIIIDMDSYLVLPITLQRRGIQLILSYLYKENPVSLSAIHTESILKMLRSTHPSGTLDLPNRVEVVKSYANVYFRFKSSSKIEETYYYKISEPIELLLPGGRLSITENQGDNSDSSLTTFLYSKDDLPLIVRTREAGDRMSLKGLGGTKKIKDIFIDYKIPIEERNTWPIIADEKGQIVWLPGLKKSDYNLEKDFPNGYIQLTYKKH